jgi:GNAT superfamily N-acetyltransferase
MTAKDVTRAASRTEIQYPRPPAGRLRVRQAESAQERMTFLQFPWKVYQYDPYWVPPLITERRDFIDPGKNPFFEHAQADYFIAWRDDEPVGTIAAFVNHAHNEVHNENIAFFGFFEVMPDREAAEALLETAQTWARERGYAALRGPAQFSVNDECALLVAGFDAPPMVLMTYNPRYYVEFIEGAGFAKAMDLYGYYIDTTTLGKRMEDLPPKLLRVVELLRERSQVKVRPLDMRDFAGEIERFKHVYNQAWERNWGFVPMTDAEIDHLARNLKPLVDPDLIFIAEIGDEPVGVSLTLPNLNEPLLKARPGPQPWSVPLTLAKFLWYRRRMSSARVVLLGTVERLRGKGVDALFYYHTVQAAFAKGYYWGEMGWILENNLMMNRTLLNFGARVYKTYRFYEKAV